MADKNKLPQVKRVEQVRETVKAIYKLIAPRYKRGLKPRVDYVNALLADAELYIRKNADNEFPSDHLLEFRHNIYTLHRIRNAMTEANLIYRMLSRDNKLKVSRDWTKAVKNFDELHKYIFLAALNDINKNVGGL